MLLAFAPMVLPLLPLAFASAAAWLARSALSTQSPPASWVGAQGSLKEGLRRWYVVRDPLRPPRLLYKVGDRVGLAVRSGDGAIYRGAAIVEAMGGGGHGGVGQTAGVTLRWLFPFTRLSGQSAPPAPGTMLRTGPEGIAHVFADSAQTSPESAPPAIETAEEIQAAAWQGTAAAAIAAATGAKITHAAATGSLQEVIIPEVDPPHPPPGAAQIEAGATKNGAANGATAAPAPAVAEDPPLMLTPEAPNPLPTVTPLRDAPFEQQRQIASDALDLVLHDPPVYAMLTEDAVPGVASHSRVVAVRAQGFDAALYIDASEGRGRLAIWRKHAAAAASVYRMADVHAALSGVPAPPASNTATAALEPPVTEPGGDSIVGIVETIAADDLRVVGFQMPSEPSAEGGPFLFADRAEACGPRLSSDRLAAWLLPAQ